MEVGVGVGVTQNLTLTAYRYISGALTITLSPTLHSVKPTHVSVRPTCTWRLVESLAMGLQRRDKPLPGLFPIECNDWLGRRRYTLIVSTRSLSGSKFDAHCLLQFGAV